MPRPMNPWSRLRAFALSIPRLILLLLGLRFLEKNGLEAFGGHDKLWLFEKMEQHRFTAMSMLTGTLKLRSALSKVQSDEEVFNGAGYTNWGYGVPLLQAPFHWLAPKLAMANHERFFPDRAIYFIYFGLMIPFVWAAFDALLAMRQAPGSSKVRRNILSWAATLAVLTAAFYPLMSCRFIIYEETICYMLIAEFLALAAYVFALQTWATPAVVMLGAAAGLGVLIRPTGAIYMCMWGFLLLLERRRLKTIGAFSAGAAPFIGFWMFSNTVRAGSPLAIGLNNSLPWFDYHTPMMRFGSLCANTQHHAWVTAKRLFTALFATTWGEPDPWMKQCHFDFEVRPAAPGINPTYEPFMGAVVLALLVWMLMHQLVRRERRLALYVPIGVFVGMFLVYVWAGGGFMWRYAADFWPAIALACVQYVRFLPTRLATRMLGIPLAMVLAGVAWSQYKGEIEPSTPTIETLDELSAAHMWDDFTNSRYEQDTTLPTHVKCGAVPSWPWHNGQGWGGDCSVNTFSNLYIGVPSKDGDQYQLRFTTQGATWPTLRVYVNGRIVTAYRVGDGYFADVKIPQSKLNSVIVMVTVEWVRDVVPIPGIKLMSIELV